MSEKLQQAIDSIQAGERSKGKQLLMEILKADPNDEQAWLWMSTVSDNWEQSRKYLKRVLAINPQNHLATKGLETLSSQIPQRTSDNWQIKAGPLLVTAGIGSILIIVSIFVARLPIIFSYSDTVRFSSSFLITILTVILYLASNSIIIGILYTFLANRTGSLTKKSGMFGGALSAVLVALVGFGFQFILEWLFIPLIIPIIDSNISFDTTKQILETIALFGSTELISVFRLPVHALLGALGGWIGMWWLDKGWIKREAKPSVSHTGNTLEGDIFFTTYVFSILGIAIILGLAIFYSGWAFGFWVLLSAASIHSLLASFAIEKVFGNIQTSLAVLIASIISIGGAIWIYLDTFIFNPPQGNAWILLFLPVAQVLGYYVILAMLGLPAILNMIFKSVILETTNRK